MIDYDLRGDGDTQDQNRTFREKLTRFYTLADDFCLDPICQTFRKGKNSNQFY